jgi:hypothetical protein
MTSSFVNVGSARVAYRVLGTGPAVLQNQPSFASFGLSERVKPPA